MQRLCLKTLTMAVVGAALAAILAGCAANPASSLPDMNSPRLAEYTLGSGDHLRIFVFGQDNIPEEYTVDDRGNVSIPLAGVIKAEGLKPQQLEAEVAKALHNVLVDPRVNVEVMEARPFFILGGVNNPGGYPYVKDMTVLTAVSLGGGFTEAAFSDYVGVTREQNGSKKQFRADPSDYIYPGDVIQVYTMY